MAFAKCDSRDAYFVQARVTIHRMHRNVMVEFKFRHSHVLSMPVAIVYQLTRSHFSVYLSKSFSIKLTVNTNNLYKSS